MSTKDEISPRKKELVIDLVRDAGVDVSDWSNYSGSPAANPKYCFDWSFVQPGQVVVLNLWHDGIEVNKGQIFQKLNLSKRLSSPTTSSREGILKRRAKRMDDAVRLAFAEGLPVRVIVLDGQKRTEEKSNVSKRLLDPVPWAVTKYDFGTGDFTLSRGAEPVVTLPPDPEFEGFEGAMRERFAQHRMREAKLRKLKIEEEMKANGGRLICEVPRCGFDFFRRYGELGRGFAHVHHREKLSLAPATGRKVTLDDLAVVCANCHAMIHAGGGCRDMHDLIPATA
jgi:5-methylcytosine-specific restriction enzyme A